MELCLSILDQTPVGQGSTPGEAIQQSIQLARLAEDLGYYRYWFTEHHNSSSLACAAPELMVARVGGDTRRLRLGTGGILLPYHSALRVAEHTRLLLALFPGRIDLGIGRASATRQPVGPLLNAAYDPALEAYVQQIEALRGYLSDRGKGLQGIQANPVSDGCPEQWLLCTGEETARVAARLGMALSYAHFINPGWGPAVVQVYKDHFRPSSGLKAPQCNVAVFVACAPTERQAEALQQQLDHRLLKAREKDPPEGAYSTAEWAQVVLNRQKAVCGTPTQVRAGLEALAATYGTGEMLLLCHAESFADRVQTYTLLAEEFRLADRPAAAESLISSAAGQTL